MTGDLRISSSTEFCGILPPFLFALLKTTFFPLLFLPPTPLHPFLHPLLKDSSFKGLSPTTVATPLLISLVDLLHFCQPVIHTSGNL